MLELYKAQTKCLVALDSIIFGFDNEFLKVLLVKRGIENDRKTWSLMGGWLRDSENLDDAAKRIVSELSGIENVYLEQVRAYGDPKRDPVERTVAITYYALIHVSDYSEVLPAKYAAEWFHLDELPALLFDHRQMVSDALEMLRYKASRHLVGLELLPEKFTLPQLQKLYEAIYGQEFDKRNFSRKLLATGMLMKTNEKQRGYSRRGAFFYGVNQEKYERNLSQPYSFFTK